MFKWNFIARSIIWPFFPKPAFGCAHISVSKILVSKIQTWSWYAILTILSSLIPHVLFINLSLSYNYFNYLVLDQKCIPSCTVPVSSDWRGLPISFKLQRTLYPIYLELSQIPQAAALCGGGEGKRKRREGDCCWWSGVYNITLHWSLLMYLNICLLSNLSLAH